jgi:hypothetical protein
MEISAARVFSGFYVVIKSIMTSGFFGFFGFFFLFVFYTILETLIPWIVLFKSEHLNVPQNCMPWGLEP